MFPKTVKIGGLKYTLHVQDSMAAEGCCARIEYQKLTITVEKAHPDFMMQALFHELIHGINGELKETDVEFLYMALFQLFKDNPKLFQKGDDHHARKKDKLPVATIRKPRTPGRRNTRRN